MQNNLLKRSLSLFIVIIMLFSVSLTFIRCSGNKNDFDDINNQDNDPNKSEKDEPSDKFDYHDKLIAPTYKEYPRKTIKFDEIAYEKPDFDGICTAFNDVISVIEANTISFEEQLEKIKSLEPGYENFLTMYSLANIYNSNDSSSAEWNEQFLFVTSNYPTFAGVVEDLYVAAANSTHAQRFEDEYFGDGLIEEYKDGGKLTDNMIKLWSEEERLEAEYSSISTANVKITFNGKEDTVDNILAEYLKKYKKESKEYLNAQTVCMQLFEEKKEAICKDIFISLIKVRKLIADELNYQSYQIYAYENLNRDYSAAQASDFIDNIAKYVVPIQKQLNDSFNYYFITNIPSKTTLDQVINNSYNALSNVDSELADIYNYMLLFKLFDIELQKTNRQDGAFTTYLDKYDAPFIFMSASNDINDYSTLMHEFGHFVDSYINFGDQTSIDQSEISSQGLEYLMLLNLENALSQKERQYLTYSMLSGALDTLISQGFYAKLEELIYALPFDKITEENLNEAVVAAAKQFGFNEKYVNNISVAFIPHMIMYPFYVQSYCTSIIPALEIYFMEFDTEGSGFIAYKKIIDRNNKDLTFVETIESAGLKSPFDADVIRYISDKIHYRILGSYFYDTEYSKDSAA